MVKELISFSNPGQIWNKLTLVSFITLFKLNKLILMKVLYFPVSKSFYDLGLVIKVTSIVLLSL